jgi:ATP-dependent exoDNAse (exonuclease V) beta subunit
LQNEATFHVYNASAGSGKTYTIAREYLQIILGNPDPNTFQRILAITFTNKAANEMKERVLSHLEMLSEGKMNTLISEIQDNLGLELSELQKRSQEILKNILQYYSAFSINTIDSFTHRLIKSFAYDLKLPMNYEVELDGKLILNEAVENLISKIGTDKELTEFLIDFAVAKADEDKSWDITRELNDVAKIILREDDVPYVEALSKRSLKEYKSLYNQLKKLQDSLTEEFQEIGHSFLELIKANNLEIGDFKGKYIPNFFTDVSTNNFNGNFLKRRGTIQKAIENHTYYNKSAKPEIVSAIESIVPQIIDHYQKCVANNGKRELIKLFLKSVNPIALISNIYNELEILKQEKQVQLNSEFNKYISDSIKDQPAPFIYERLGQRYRYFFIDEMQDTSVLQWQNLVPLLNNALAQENSRLYLVGDAKQSIYRWRGGKAEQFIELGDENQNTFQVHKITHQLPRNYRSYSKIIDFNNQFFTHVAGYFQDANYGQLYINENQQKLNDKEGGFVSLQFLELEGKRDDKLEQYAEQTYETIQGLRSDYDLDEICVLVRKNDAGVAIANYLSEKNIDVISSETLLLENSAKVQFVINMFRLLQNRNDDQLKFELLYFLYDHLKVSKPKHSFFSNALVDDDNTFLSNLNDFGIQFSFDQFLGLSIYEIAETLVRLFKLNMASDAHLKFVLDVLLERQKKGGGISDFLEFWELKKDKLSISAAEKKNAVRIMTIHKSKGLEFPVVVFPCDLNIHDLSKSQDWYEGSALNKELPPFLVPTTKNLSEADPQGEEIYNRNKSQNELDNINLLYVALTRSVEQLYVISGNNGMNSERELKTNYFSGMFMDYLQQKGMWKDIQSEYTFGSKQRKSQKSTSDSNSKDQIKFTSVSWKDHQLALLNSSSKLWDTERGKAIAYGNLIHDMLARITSESDIEMVVENDLNNGMISKSESEEIKKLLVNVVSHPKLKSYFSRGYKSFNERELTDGFHQIVKPDKLLIKDQKAVIIDYKTGQSEEKHKTQIRNYAGVLQQLNFDVQKKILVYLNDEIDVQEVQ